MLERTTALVMACALVVLPVASETQRQHVVDESDLQALMDQRLGQEQDHRAAVIRVLSRSELQPFVDIAGLDLRSAEVAIATLPADELDELASQARALEQELIGGQGAQGRSIRPILAIIAFVAVIAIIFLITRD